MLIGDVAGDGFDQILNGHQPVDPAVFVDHERHVDSLLAHLQQQIQHRHLRPDHQRLAEDRFQRERLGLADIGKHVLHVDHTNDVVQLLPIHRQTGVAVVADQFNRLFQSHVGAHGDDVGTGDHDVVGGGFPQPQHVGDQRPFVPVEFRDFPGHMLRIRGFLHQLGDGVAQGVFGLLAAQQHPQAGDQRPAHARRHGLGTPMPNRIRDSAISMCRASPGWW